MDSVSKTGEDSPWMLAALDEARQALEHDDVPVGAIVVYQNRLISRAHNRREVDRDPLAHAEILAIGQAARVLDRWRLSGCSLYVTLEPCSMCAGALVQARIDRLIFAAKDPRTGACGSIYNIVEDSRLNHRVQLSQGLMHQSAAELLRDFFRARRKA